MKRLFALFLAMLVMMPLIAVSPASAAEDITIAFPEKSDLQVTITNPYEVYSYAGFVFNPAQMAYSMYINDDSTVTFSADTTLVFTDMTTYAQTPTTFTAGTAVTAGEINGGALYLTEDTVNGPFATFMKASDPTYAQGVAAATDPITKLAAGGAPAAVTDETPVVAPAANGSDIPSELSTAFSVGTWPLAAGTYDPALDGNGIPDGAVIYGLFDAAYATIPVPASVTGYTSVGSADAVTAGSYYVLMGSSGFNYVILGADGTSAVTPPAASSGGNGVPPELATAFQVGVWPMAAGTYDPALDGNGIIDGTVIYGLFDAAYATIPAPASVTGYAEVNSADAVTEGTYYVLVGSSGFSYVLLGTGGSVPAPAPAPAPIAAAPAAAAGYPALPETRPAGNKVVTVSVSLEGKLVLAAYPFALESGKDTVIDAFKAAHDAFYPGGAEAGFADGMDTTYNMYTITKAWGVAANPTIIFNHGVLSGTANEFKLENGDNVIFNITANAFGGATLLSPFGVINPDTGDFELTVRSQAMDYSSFSYIYAPVANATVADFDGNVLGVTNIDGKLVIPAAQAKGIAIISGSAGMTAPGQTAIPIDGSSNAVGPDYTLFGGRNGRSLAIIVFVGLGAAIPLFIVVLFAQRKELSGGGVKFAQAKFSID
jgi:hypothetical protein